MKISLKRKLIVLVLVPIIPMLILSIYVIQSVHEYAKAYDLIVSSMTVANEYNLEFKNQYDESIYKMVGGYFTLEDIENSKEIKKPNELTQELRTSFEALVKTTSDSESRIWLQSLLRNLDSLDDKYNKIQENLKEGGHYNENIKTLETSVYILTELIQDNIQKYIYYQTKGIDNLKNRLEVQISGFLIMAMVMTISISVLAGLITLLISQAITNPIVKLSEITKKIAKGDFGVRAEVTSADEIGDLTNSINDMTKHLEASFQKIKDDERKMRNADLRLLQEQINPHFLYNTLETIVWLIEDNQQEKAEEVVLSLSTFFRTVLAKGKEYVTVREEEKHIRSYLEIQQVRYKDILDYTIDISPEISNCRMLKMTLQPLVENALYHGIKYKRAKGTIAITGRKEENSILLCVADDGIGMEKEELERLRGEIIKPCKETEKGFGMANVNERIRMNFGEEYGMAIYSEKGEGCRVEIRLPVLEMGNGKEYR